MLSFTFCFFIFINCNYYYRLLRGFTLLWFSLFRFLLLSSLYLLFWACVCSFFFSSFAFSLLFPRFHYIFLFLGHLMSQYANGIISTRFSIIRFNGHRRREGWNDGRPKRENESLWLHRRFWPILLWSSRWLTLSWLTV